MIAEQKQDKDKDTHGKTYGYIIFSDGKNTSEHIAVQINVRTLRKGIYRDTNGNGT